MGIEKDVMVYYDQKFFMKFGITLGIINNRSKWK
jgi:hypothetical protein